MNPYQPIIMLMAWLLGFFALILCFRVALGSGKKSTNKPKTSAPVFARYTKDSIWVELPPNHERTAPTGQLIRNNPDIKAPKDYDAKFHWSVPEAVGGHGFWVDIHFVKEGRASTEETAEEILNLSGVCLGVHGIVLANRIRTKLPAYLEVLSISNRGNTPTITCDAEEIALRGRSRKKKLEPGTFFFVFKPERKARVIFKK